VRTRAEHDGDDYVVNGSKIWTSGAEHADWIFCLVRTNPDVQQQKGISFLLLDITSPGVSVEPLYAFNGKRLWNQVFFEDVRVPVSQRLGDEDRGWTVAKSLLGDERLMVSRVAENKRILGNLRETYSHQMQRGVQLPELAKKHINELDIRLQALEATSLRILTAFDGGDNIGAEPSMLKLKGSELVQAQDELLFAMVDYLALPLDAAKGGDSVTPDWAEYVASGRYHHRGFTIAGGSSEVQHNIIAKQVLGL
jgi:acyl-CoA dehydrogenase